MLASLIVANQLNLEVLSNNLGSVIMFRIVSMVPILDSSRVLISVVFAILEEYCWSVV